MHGDLDPRPVLHERHLRGRGERRRHERGHEQGVHQRGEVKKIISNNVYQAEIFILDFNNALCLNFGFSYFLSFCAGSFFMVITLIFKLNNCNMYANKNGVYLTIPLHTSYYSSFKFY